MKILINNKINKADKDIANKIFFEGRKNYEFKTINWNYPKSKQFIIYLKNNNSTIGMVRVIKKKIFLSGKFYNAACLSTIGVLPNSRNKGYGKILMEKTNQYLEKKFDIFVLIARKKLDFFYSKFNFIGNSEFYSILLNFKKKDSNRNLKKFKFQLHDKKQINDNLKKLNISSNRKKSGYFYKKKNDWKIINNKIRLNKFIIKEFTYKNKSIGYIVFKKNCIYEYGYNIKHLKHFIHLVKIIFSRKLEIKNPDQSMINELRKNDEINIYKRLCVYGGHMINVNGNEELKNINYNINYLDEF